ncbi:MAG TPA: endonuclease/exonuclease/phosphatase family protein [Kofleriaceae bacterium]|nr:endonuclease/exonuclease/phosphatase family protein [Kofleriaceae bacterium]
MKRSALVACVLAAVACRAADPAASPVPDAPPAPHVRIATFNVHRFFDTVCDSGDCGGSAYEALPSPAEFDAKAAQLADAIRALDADVVALEEVETQACLDALLARLGDAMPYGVLGEIDTAASVDVAVLSRTALDAVVRHRAGEILQLADGRAALFSRELLEVHVRAASGAPLIVFAAHFRSKSDDDPARRLAEAEQAALDVNAAAAAHPDALVALAGDLNDVPDSPPLAALVATGGLVRVADDLPRAAQATYVFNGQGQAIDHILIAPDHRAARLPASSRVWRPASGGGGWGGSDHFALSSDFAL